MEHVSHRVWIIATRVLCLACLAGGLDTGHVQAETPGQPQKDEEASLLRISAARSIAGTGLIGFLAARFGEDNPDIDVRVQSVGALTALEHGYEGQTDLVITHYPAGEDRLVSRGYGSDHAEFMYSEYAIFGPPSDTLRLAASDSHVEALRQLRDAEVDMFVPSPRSGTYFKLQELWASAGIEPDWVGYENTGTSGLATMQQAAVFEGYVFADLGLYMLNRERLADTLVPLYQDRVAMKNPVSAIVVNADQSPGVNQAAARRFLNYLISDAGQNAITVFSQQIFGKDTYVASAHEDQFVVNLKLLRELAGERQLRYLMMAVVALLVLLALMAVVFARRVTRLERERLLAEQERVDAERLRKMAEQAGQEKARFLAEVSHEIRGPVGSIHNMAQLLSESDLSEEQGRLAGVLNQSSEFLLYIANDVLDLSRMESGRLTLEAVNLDIREVVGNLMTSLHLDADAGGVRLNCSIDPAIPPVLLGDPLRLQQILYNLVGNAIKFTGHGEVDVSVAVQKQDTKGCELRWEVRDTGIGIEPGQQRTLFDMYTQGAASTARRYGGSGLGLAICKQLVELMDGTIQVESVPGKGSIFWYTTRLAAGDRPLVAPAKTTPVTDHLTPLCGRVLFVEDDIANRQAGASLLDLLGCEVDAVCDGRDAVDAVMRDRYDLVIMDCDLPGMDGYEATRYIRQWESQQGDGRHVPIVAMTGSVREGIEQRCLNVGMDAYLAKPYRKEQLHRILCRLLPGTEAEFP